MRSRRVAEEVAALALLACLGTLSAASSAAAPRVPPPTAATAVRRPGSAAEARAVTRFLARDAVLRCGGTHGDEVALTFDDGPTSLTSRLLAILAAHRVKATFFLIGRNIRPERGAVKAEAAAGDEIGNHSWSHPDLTTLAPAELARELGATSAAIRALTGTAPRLMRPPGGDHDGAVDAAIRAQRMVETLWSVDPRDWASNDPGSIARSVLAAASPGAIILLHDGRPATLAALPTILDRLTGLGLHPVTVPRLLLDDPPTSTACAPPASAVVREGTR